MMKKIAADFMLAKRFPGQTPKTMRFRQHCGFRFALAAAAIMLAGAADAAPSLDGVNAQIDQQGASHAVAHLANTDDAAPGATLYDAVMSKVQDGDPSWLQVAARLYPATDGGNRFALLNSVSLALQKNPGGVLALTDTVFRIDDVCENRLIEPTPDASRVFRQKTLDALRRVADPRLRHRRDACLKLLS